jgi:drug/metabolite transporter (DMT)-like permease
MGKLLGSILWVFLVSNSAYAQSSNDNLKKFLTSCAYGTAAGGLVGLATLAFTDDPGNKLNNITRGVSLGLYAGIGWGLYLVYAQPEASNQDVAWAVLPKENNGKVDGGQFLISKSFF